jgi:type II secretory pathway pseudopilin PulG
MPSGAAFSSRAPNLLPVADRPEATGWRRRELWAPAGLILVLALVAIAVPLWQKRSHAVALGQLVQQARLQANASDALRQQLEQLAGDYNFALQRKYAFPSTMQVLDDLTRLLPDDTWLTQLEVKTLPKSKEPHRDIVLRGESSNAGRLVSLLEESKLFEQAAPRSPTTKIQPGPGEIFDLGAQLKPLTPPPPVQLADSTNPPAPSAAAAAAVIPPSPSAAAAAAIPPSPSPPAETAKDVAGARNGAAGVAETAPVAAEPPPAPPTPTTRTEQAPGS